MKVRDYFRLGWDQINRRKVVTALCVLGIAIGSASIIVAIAFGESIQHYSQQQLSYYLKTDEISIHEGNSQMTRYVSSSGQTAIPGQGQASVSGQITKEKLDLIRTFPHVKAVASFQKLQQFSFTADDGKRGFIELIATELNTLTNFGAEFQQGSYSDRDNIVILNYGATLGLSDEKTQQARSRLIQQNQSRETMDTLNQLSLIPYPLYQKQIKLQRMNFQSAESDGSVIRNTEIPLRVFGILKKPDGIPDNMVSNMKQAYISPEMGEKLLAAFNSSSSGQKIGVYSEVKVKVDDASHVKEVEAMIQKLKLSTQSNLYQQDRMKDEFVIVRLILTGVGLFVLFVASISIIVAMTMSTYQRRRQIGIMKVLGANLRQIRNMFIVESSLLGFLGGLAGIILSYWVIWGINIVVIKFSSGAPGSDLEILFISLWILPVGMFFALLTGILSGLYPAVKASRTDALTAIKRE